MKNITLSLFFIFQILSFSTKSQNNDCVEPFRTYDTVTVYGNFIQYHVNNKKAKLEYGNNILRTYFPDEFDCDIADAWVPKFKYENKDFMLLHYGCGSTCWGLIMLSLNAPDQIRKIMYDLAYDPETTTLVYTDNENLLLENLTTGEIKKIQLPECQAANMVYCLDSVRIIRSELQYQFYGTNKMDEKRVKTQYNVKIK